MITIIPFEEKYLEDFKRLNIEWLQQYFIVETYDEYQLSNAGKEIIEKGGYIFLAKDDGGIIGTVALMKENDRSFEITKIYLYSNTLLVPAIQLYRRYGFKEIIIGLDPQYKRTNIKMELKLV